jgi:hypothetical protein
VPHFGNGLGDRRVVKIQVLDEGDDVGGVLRFPGVLVPSIGRVTKEGGVAHVAHRLPMLVSWIPQELRAAENTIWGKVVTSPESESW